MKTQNPFEQFVVKDEVKEIKKSEIFSALKDGPNKMMFKKSGKDIKEHIENEILPYLIEKKDEIKIQIDNFLSNAVVLPTQTSYYGTIFGEEEFPYKKYTWEETHWVEKSFGNVFKGFGDCEEYQSCGTELDSSTPISSPHYPISEAEADARDKYNRWVSDYQDITLDIKTANVLISNINNKDEYWLDLVQLTALKFEK